LSLFAKLELAFQNPIWRFDFPSMKALCVFVFLRNSMPFIGSPYCFYQSKQSLQKAKFGRVKKRAKTAGNTDEKRTPRPETQLQFANSNMKPSTLNPKQP